MITTALAGLCLTLPFYGFAADWTLVGDDDGIEVYMRSTASGFNEVRAKTTIDAPLALLVRTYANAETYSEWMSQCVSSRRVGSSGSYIRIDVPIPFIKDRDVVIDTVRTSHTPTEAIFEGQINTAALAEVAGVVRMHAMQNRWMFRAVTKDTTLVEMYQRMEPGGSMPAFGFNRSLKSSSRKTLLGLSRYVANLQ